MTYAKPFLKSVLSAVTLTAILAAALAPSAASASSLHATPSLHALMGSKQKMVHFSLRNQTGAPIELRAGDQVMTVATGQTMDLRLAIGTRILTTTKSDKREAGAVVCEVSPQMGDSTVVLN